MDSWIDQFALPAFVTGLGIYQMGSFGRAVANSRRKHKISPPETNGPPEFIRIFRAQQNCFEFYPMSVVVLWTASAFVHPVPASLVYCGYMYARNNYFKGYAASADGRLKPFYMSVKCIQILVYLTLAGACHKAIRYYGNVDVWKMLLDALPSLSN